MPDDVALEFVSTLDDLRVNYPETASGLRFIGSAGDVTRAVSKATGQKVKPMSKRDLAEARRVGDVGILRFDPVNTSDRAKLAQLKDEGFLATGTPEGVVRHEFGHQWDWTHLAIKEGPLKGLTSDAADSVIKATVDEMTNMSVSVRELLGRYGASNPKEMVAEAFAEVTMAEAAGGSARPFAQTLIDRLRAL